MTTDRTESSAVVVEQEAGVPAERLLQHGGVPCRFPRGGNDLGITRVLLGITIVLLGGGVGQRDGCEPDRCGSSSDGQWGGEVPHIHDLLLIGPHRR